MAATRYYPRAVYDLLLIDEHAYDIELIRAVLGDRNHRLRLNTVLTSEALDFIERRGKYVDAPLADLVLLDVSAADSAATELLRAMRAHPIWKLIPVVAVAEESGISECYDLGANACGLDALASIIAAIATFWFLIAMLLPPEENCVAWQTPIPTSYISPSHL